MKTPQERIAKRRADMPEKYRKQYDRCTSGEASPRQAIKMQCLECWGWVLAEVKECDNYPCPLYRYRPFQSRAKSPRERVKGQNSGKASPEAVRHG